MNSITFLETNYEQKSVFRVSWYVYEEDTTGQVNKKRREKFFEIKEDADKYLNKLKDASYLLDVKTMPLCAEIKLEIGG